MKMFVNGGSKETAEDRGRPKKKEGRRRTQKDTQGHLLVPKGMPANSYITFSNTIRNIFHNTRQTKSRRCYEKRVGCCRQLIKALVWRVPQAMRLQRHWRVLGHW